MSSEEEPDEPDFLEMALISDTTESVEAQAAWWAEQTLLSSSTDASAKKPAAEGAQGWHRWVPFAPGYWRYHFGTDMLVASWLFLLGSALWAAMTIEALATNTEHEFYVSFSYECTLASAVSFTVGSAVFVWLSYPDALEAQMRGLVALAADPEKAKSMTWVERNFTGSDMLVATWSFALATTPIAVYGFYAVFSYPTYIYGYVFLAVAAFSFGCLLIWIVAAMPENMIANEGTGSTLFYDIFFESDSRSCCCSLCNGVLKKSMKTHAHSDMLFGMWGFMVLCFASLPLCVAYVSLNPSSPDAWLYLIDSLLFAMGTALMTYSTYPENFKSSWFYDTVTCSKTKGSV